MDRFNIADVANLFGIVGKRRGDEFYATCPFCGDTRDKFSYILNKNGKENLYKCWHCEAKGNAIDLFMNLSPSPEYSGPDGGKAAIRDIFKALNGDAGYELYHAESLKEFEDTEKYAVKASDEQISKVYYALLKLLDLKEEHAADLKKRGLTDEDIKRFRFKSLPQTSAQVNDICIKLLKAGFSLEGVPGFYKNKKDKWSISLMGSMDKNGKWMPLSGYFCPAYDGDFNLIIGMQIRLDNPPKEIGKYVWFSSSSKKMGVSSGAVATYLPGKFENAVIVVEGILKSTVCYCLLGGNISVIGTPGTATYKSSRSYLARMSDVFVYEAYDMDKAIKSDDLKVQEKTEKIAKEAIALQKIAQDLSLPCDTLIWDYFKEKDEENAERVYWKENVKGLDDFLVNYPDRDKFISYIQKKALKSVKMKKYFDSCN